MTAMGVSLTHHRARLMMAVAELVGGGATQVYIRAASLGWKILKEEEKRKIPRNLLRKIIRMKMNNDRVILRDHSINKVRTYSYHDWLPLSLIQLSHKYSMSLSTHMREVEGVLEELWKEEFSNNVAIQKNDQHDILLKSVQNQVLPRFSTFLPRNQPRTKSNCNQVYKISNQSLSLEPSSQTSPTSRSNW